MSTRRHLLTNTLSAWATYGLSGPLRAAAAAASPLSGKALAAFRDESEFVQALQRWRNASLQLPAPERRRPEQFLESTGPAAPAVSAKSMAPAAADSKAAETGAPSPGAPVPPAESITNVQTAGVDEGGIVKHAGDFLVILRRGRLFSVRVGGNALEPAAAGDAYGPGTTSCWSPAPRWW